MAIDFANASHRYASVPRESTDFAALLRNIVANDKGRVAYKAGTRLATITIDSNRKVAGAADRYVTIEKELVPAPHGKRHGSPHRAVRAWTVAIWTDWPVNANSKPRAHASTATRRAIVAWIEAFGINEKLLDRVGDPILVHIEASKAVQEARADNTKAKAKAKAEAKAAHEALCGRLNRGPLIDDIMAAVLAMAPPRPIVMPSCPGIMAHHFPKPNDPADVHHEREIGALREALEARPTKHLVHPMALAKILEDAGYEEVPGLARITATHLRIARNHVDIFDAAPAALPPPPHVPAVLGKVGALVDFLARQDETTRIALARRFLPATRRDEDHPTDPRRLAVKVVYLMAWEETGNEKWLDSARIFEFACNDADRAAARMAA